MSRRAAIFLSLLFLSLAPIPVHAQCGDMLCRNLQDIMDAAVTDFRGYRADKTTAPDVSLDGAKIPCQMSTWANNVPMYICYAQISFASAQQWYVQTLQVMRDLNPSWQFKINSPGQDHYVDGGPPDCEVPPTEGPYIGQCPLHVQIAKQPDGSTKVYFIVNSFSSPFLLKHVPTAPAKATPPAPAVNNGCDDFCQNLKKAFEARSNAFETLRTGKADDGTEGTSVKLPGAKECAVNVAPGAGGTSRGTQFVCYWREGSANAADARFRDLVARLQVLIPSNWSSRQGNELDDFTGSDMTAWSAVEPNGKHAVYVYLAGESVGLHISASQ